MKIGDKSNPKFQQSEILTKTTSEFWCDLTNGNGGQQNLIIYENQTGLTSLDRLLAERDNNFLPDLVRDGT
ncbi:Uncharacterized protein dnm_081490 [Desulfonema magnum]|uniref:Uncharacterized protein n=1 Tax=Desulfonema magnum TaxID=45655 RepID=A0A975BUI3_9BACT|nr:hypothetical protein [Desulfonema magnum]QTA92075.1 Uncharacterized protein dnm_081490 [Desulfonema magnum]